MTARIIFGQPWFDEVEEKLVLSTLRSGWIGQGPLVERFERQFNDYVGARRGVAVNSCTAALHLSLVALGIGAGDEVITTPFTFVATVNAIEHAGATPILVDVERDTLNVSPEQVAQAITDRTRAIMPVHFGGRPADTMALYALAEAHDLWVVEDAAHAVGAVANGTRLGGSGHPRSLTCFSFYPNKNLASAEGGIICLADDSVAERLGSLRLHGLRNDAWARYRDDSYQPSLAAEPGYKYNWTDLQAAIALGQLEKFEGFLAMREYLADLYDAALTGTPGVRTLQRDPPSLAWRHGLHLYQVALDDQSSRDRVVSELREAGIGAAVHYIGVNLHPYYRERFSGVETPVSDWASAAVLTLPLHPRMARADVERVAAALTVAVS